MSLHRERTHPEYVEGCFGCKISTQQLSAGAASSKQPVSAKKWDSRLQAYRDARKEGIEPRGTSWQAINEARSLSDKVGKAYNGDTNSFKD